MKDLLQSSRRGRHRIWFLKFANMGVPIVVSARGLLYSGLTATALFKVTIILCIRRGGRVRGPVILTYPERVIGYERKDYTLPE